jgi:hypothetical protein
VSSQRPGQASTTTAFSKASTDRDAALRTERIFYVAMFTSMIVILVVGLVAFGPVYALSPPRMIPDPTHTSTLVMWCTGFLMLAASFAVKHVVAPDTPQKALTLLILQMGMTEACVFCGFIAALFLEPQVRELLVLPAIAAILVALMRMPTASQHQLWQR